VLVGPQNNSRYGSDGPRLRQPVDGSTDAVDRDSATGRPQQQQQLRAGNDSLDAHDKQEASRC